MKICLCQYHIQYIFKSWHGSCFICILITIEKKVIQVSTRNPETRGPSIGLRTPGIISLEGLAVEYRIYSIVSRGL